MTRRAKLILLTTFIFTTPGCMLFIIGVGTETYIDYTLWTMREERGIDQMNYTIRPLLFGYYRKADSRGGFPNVFYLTSDGYFVFSGPTRIRSMPHADFTSFRMEWGRYMISGDSLEIQYFRDTNLGLFNNRILWRYDLAVRIGYGVIANDSTLLIHKDVSWCSVGCDSIGSYTYYYDPPLKYTFVPTDTIPPNENWIKHLDYSKKKLE